MAYGFTFAPYTPGRTLSARLIDPAGATALTVPLPESGLTPGYYSGKVGAGLPAGTYSVIVYDGSEPVSALATLNWDGSQEVAPAPASGSVTMGDVDSEIVRSLTPPEQDITLLKAGQESLTSDLSKLRADLDSALSTLQSVQQAQASTQTGFSALSQHVQALNAQSMSQASTLAGLSGTVSTLGTSVPALSTQVSAVLSAQSALGQAAASGSAALPALDSRLSAIESVVARIRTTVFGKMIGL